MSLEASRSLKCIHLDISTVTLIIYSRANTAFQSWVEKEEGFLSKGLIKVMNSRNLNLCIPWLLKETVVFVTIKRRENFCISVCMWAGNPEELIYHLDPINIRLKKHKRHIHLLVEISFLNIVYTCFGKYFIYFLQAQPKYITLRNHCLA